MDNLIGDIGVVEYAYTTAAALEEEINDIEAHGCQIVSITYLPLKSVTVLITYRDYDSQAGTLESRRA